MRNSILNQIDKMESGQRYQLTVREYKDDFTEFESVIKGEFRGFYSDGPYADHYYVMFWKDGDSKAEDYHPGDILKILKL